MNGHERSGLQLLLELTAVTLALGVQVLAELYLTDADFRYAVDVRLGRVRYLWRRAEWETRYRRLPGWVQEGLEQIHGRP